MLKKLMLILIIFLISSPSFVFAQSPEQTNAANLASDNDTSQKELMKRKRILDEEEDDVSNKHTKTVQYGFGLQSSYNYIPEFALHLALKAAHDVRSPSYGVRFIIRKKDVDIIVKGIYWNINPPDGNWLGINHDWDDMDYTEFKNLSLTYVEVSAVWNAKIMNNLYFIYGGGIGGGYVGGDIYTTPAYGCNADNWRDVRTDGTGCFHSPLDPNREKEDIPRGMAVLEATIGLRMDFTKNISAKIETGFLLPGFFYGTAALEFFF